MLGVALTKVKTTSKAIINRYAEIGSPCLVPLSNLKFGVVLPLLITHDPGFFDKICIGFVSSNLCFLVTLIFTSSEATPSSLVACMLLVILATFTPLDQAFISVEFNSPSGLANFSSWSLHVILNQVFSPTKFFCDREIETLTESSCWSLLLKVREVSAAISAGVTTFCISKPDTFKKLMQCLPGKSTSKFGWHLVF